jgi:Polysaccharide lyase
VGKSFRWTIALLLLAAMALVVGWHVRRARAAEWEYLSAGKPYSIANVADPLGSGETCLRFELRAGETWVNTGSPTYRAEIETPEHPPINSVRWYSFGLMLPQDFPIEDNRLALAQWHGTDKKSLGEPSRIPVMAFRYRNGEFNITMRHSEERIVHDPDAVRAEALFRTKPLPLNVWNYFVVEARWSYTPDGFVNIWWNGKQIVQYRGPVGYNDDAGPYFQFGIYRDETDKTYVTYMKDVRMGGTAAEVGFK